MIRIDTSSLKAHIDLISLFERDGNKMRNTTGHMMCICPFHAERTPSCHVWNDHFHCFGCHARGDAIEYIQQTRGKTFRDAVETLGGRFESLKTSTPRPPKPVESDRIGTCPDFASMAKTFSSSVSDEMMDDASVKLGVLTESLWWIGAGWCEKHKAWSFPMHDGAGSVIGIRLRTKDGKKFAVTGSRSGIFIPSIAPDRRIFIMEGPTDTAAALTLGFYGIGRPSCNGALEYVLAFIRNNPNIREAVIVTDNDSPGLKGAEELRKAIPLLTWQLLLPPKDIRRYCQIGGSRKLIESMINSQIPRK